MTVLFDDWKKNSREEERRGETVSTSLARQGEKQRERGVRANSPSHTNPCQHWVDSAMPSYSPAHFSPAAKREVSTAWERKRKQGGDSCDHLAARSLASSVVVGSAASPPCLIPLWVLAQNAKHRHLAQARRRGVELGPKPSEISKSQPIPQERSVA